VDAIKIANKKHDLIAVQIYDERETNLPDVGIIRVKDAESGAQQWVDSSDFRQRAYFKKWNDDHEAFLNDTFLRSGVDWVKIRTDQDYVKPLINLFKKRGARK
jgi:hypothetical protein